MADPAPVPLVSLLTEVEDPRRPQARRHSLEAILLIATLAVICGADNGTEVEFFGHQKQAWLETFLGLLHGIPSHNAFGHIFARLDPTQRKVCFTGWIQSLATAFRNQVVSVDGKAAHRFRDAVRGVTDRDSTWGRPTETVHQLGVLWTSHTFTSSKPKQLRRLEVRIGQAGPPCHKGGNCWTASTPSMPAPGP